MSETVQKTPYIHPTAVIADGAVIGAGCSIGPYCVIGEHVKLGALVTLKSHVVIDGDTEIGDGTTIFPFASIGSQPQDLKYKGERSKLVIGKSNLIREHVTMNPGTEGDRMLTQVGDNCLFMVGSHVAHDCTVGNNVILANNATLAGHVTVEDFVIIGGLSAVQQFVRLGAHAMIGGMSGVESDVIPFGLVKGERATLAGLNLVGLERRGYEKSQIQVLMRVFKDIFYGDKSLSERVDAVASANGDDKTVMAIIDFLKARDNRPVCQPKKRND